MDGGMAIEWSRNVNKRDEDVIVKGLLDERKPRPWMCYFVAITGNE
jgi:hypothetical protein